MISVLLVKKKLNSGSTQIRTYPKGTQTLLSGGRKSELVYWIGMYNRSSVVFHYSSLTQRSADCEVGSLLCSQPGLVNSTSPIEQQATRTPASPPGLSLTPSSLSPLSLLSFRLSRAISNRHFHFVLCHVNSGSLHLP